MIEKTISFLSKDYMAKASIMTKIHIWGVIYILFSSSIFFASCSENIYNDAETNIVVEGWICQSLHPMVYISKSVSVSEAYTNYKTIGDSILITNAEVFISCEGIDYPLLPHIDSTKLLRCYYSCDDLCGQENKSYVLHVRWGNFNIESETRIPSSRRILGLSSKRIENTNNFLLCSTVQKPLPNEYGYIFVKIENLDNEYLLAPSTGISGLETNDSLCEIQIPRPTHQYLKENKLSYNINERVSIRYTTMNQTMFDFWQDYVERLDLSRNPLFPMHTNLQVLGNNCIGYWTGYGCSYDSITIK